MKTLPCPHCGEDRIPLTRAPKDVVVVVPCPACGELVVLFRNKTMALDREIITSGTKRQQVLHLAEIIAEFLEPGMFGVAPEDAGAAEPEQAGERQDGAPAQKAASPPITSGDVDRFVRVELPRIDETGYFRKYFG